MYEQSGQCNIEEPMSICIQSGHAGIRKYVRQQKQSLNMHFHSLAVT